MGRKRCGEAKHGIVSGSISIPERERPNSGLAGDKNIPRGRGLEVFSGDL